MAISVAPLTTTVMNSVRESRAGIASGINNAVSRTAGLLAIAVLGLVMFHAFNNCLNQQLDETGVAPEVRQALDNQRVKLAAIELPANIDERTQTAIRQAIDQCFVTGYRRVMLLGAALAFCSSMVAWVLIRSR
jgi:hypothetical protein